MSATCSRLSEKASTISAPPTAPHIAPLRSMASARPGFKVLNELERISGSEDCFDIEVLAPGTEAIAQIREEIRHRLGK